MKKMKVLTLLVLSVSLSVLIPSRSIAQNPYGEKWVEASPASKAYHKYRIKNTIPPYSLDKIKAIIKKIDLDEDGNAPLDSTVYENLSFQEKFTYNMIYAEWQDQNCDVIPPILNEHKKIFANLPDAFDELGWSPRQDSFFIDNKLKVLDLIKESVGRSKRIGINYKRAIVIAKGNEIIPFLIDVYKKDYKDYDILTVLVLLMKEAHYSPFTSSASYVKLYGKKSNYQSFINYNKANEQLILSRALAFYNETK